MLLIRNNGGTIFPNLESDGTIVFEEDALIKTEDKDLMYRIVGTSKNISVVNRKSRPGEQPTKLKYYESPNALRKRRKKQEVDDAKRTWEHLMEMGLTGNLWRLKEV